MASYPRISILLLLILIGLIIIRPRIVFAAEHDYEYSREIKYELHKVGDGFPIRAEYSIDYIYLTERATETKTHYISDDTYSPIDKMQVRLNGKKLKDYEVLSIRNEFYDAFISDRTIYRIRPERTIVPGDTMSIKYRQQFEYPALLPLLFVPNIDYVKKVRVVFKHRKEFNVSSEAFYPRDSVPVAVDKSDPEKTIFEIGPVEYHKPVPLFAYNGAAMYLMFKITYEGEPVTPTSIDDFISWYGTLTDLSPGIDFEQDSLADPPSFNCGADIYNCCREIHKFVADSFRYIGDSRDEHSIMPYSPLQVYESKYGDCKDRAALIAALAAHYGFKVNMALIGVDDYPLFEGTHPGLFDHAINYFNMDGRDYFLDATWKYFPFTRLPTRFSGKKVLIVDSENPRYIVPQIDISQPLVDVKITADIAALDAAHASITLRREYYAAALDAHETRTPTEFDNRCDSIITPQIYKMRLENFTLGDVYDDSLILNADADLSDFAIASSSNIYFPKMPFNIFDYEQLERADDDWPLYFRDLDHFRLTITLAHPGYSANSDSTRLGDSEVLAFGGFQNVRDDSLSIYSYSYYRPVKTAAASLKKNLLDIGRQILDIKNSVFVLKRSAP